ncbi:MAG: DUF2147 domain-containing protein [Hyphomicrobium sp.]|nr:DUF2147 domain-containing protein [Hyphomicrobium sp.]
MTVRSIVRSTALIGAVVLGTPVLGTQAALAGGDPTGVWMNDSGEGAIEITPCGSKMCGRLVWIKNKADIKRGCGKQIIGEVAKVGSSTWDNGWIYSPEKKRKFDVELKPLSNGNLKVTGYMGSKMFSQSFIWKPAPGDLMRCDGSGTIMASADPKADVAKSADQKPKSNVASTSEKSKGEKVALTEPTAPPSALGGPKGEPATEPAAEIIPPKPVPAVRPPKPVTEDKEEVAAAEPNLLPGDPPRGNVAEGVTTDGEAAADATPDDAASSEDDEEPAATPRLSRLAQRLRELEQETGYGLKKTGSGKCLLKVPYATIEIPCKK